MVVKDGGLPWYNPLKSSLKNQIQENKEHPLISSKNGGKKVSLNKSKVET